jgi:tRNA(Ile)-lysidine synthase
MLRIFLSFKLISDVDVKKRMNVAAVDLRMLNQVLLIMQKVEKKILRIVRQTIATHRMFAVGDSVLVAVSGGADSVALAQVLITLAGEYSLRLAVAHLNHSLRGKAADSDAEFVAAFARGLNLPVYIEKKDVRAFQRRRHLSLEEAARQVRYEFFDKIAVRYGFNKIALGHHGHDNAELVLMNLLRGSGPLGLSGIIPVRDGKIVRPFIHLKRSDIQAYIAEKKLPHVTDASNADTSLRRNRIRHHLIPELENTYNPGIVDTLNRLGTIMRAEDQWIEGHLSPVFNKCVTTKRSGAISLDIARLGKLATAAKRRIIRKAIFSVKKDLRRITLLHVDDVLTLMEKGPDHGCLNLPRGIQVARNAAELTITCGGPSPLTNQGKRAGSMAADYQYSISSPGTLCIQEAGVIITLTEIGVDDVPELKNIDRRLAFFDMASLHFPLVVRNIRPGDRFSPLGLNGSQKVKKYFNNHKIPGCERRKCAVLLSDGRIIWLVGHRIENCVKLGPNTRQVLKAELLLA